MRILSDVTLCSADCAHPLLAARALRKSLEECEFAEAILFSDVFVSGPFRNVAIPALCSRRSYSEFVLKRLISYISTPFVLIVQWDGYVVCSRAWRSEFQEYDYIGAEWPWHNDAMTVGNGGFSLRSRRLLELTASPTFGSQNDSNEDELICRIHRPQLEKQNSIRFAPVPIANVFSYERGAPNSPTFGFHGLFNMWRHVEDSAVINIINSLNAPTLCTREFVELLAQYVAMRKFSPAIALFSKLKSSLSTAIIGDLFRRSIGDSSNADKLLKKCVSLTQE
jgi:hypothetical protein